MKILLLKKFLYAPLLLKYIYAVLIFREYRIKQIAARIASISYASFNKSESRTLDLGCGAIPRNPFGASTVYGVDLNTDKSTPFIKGANLSLEPIPFDSSSFEFVTAFDFLEHLPRVITVNSRTIFPVVNLFNEIYRVLKPGGVFLHVSPRASSGLFWMDPTHVNPIHVETVKLYFCSSSTFRKPTAQIYGFNGVFIHLTSNICGPWLIQLIRKV